MENSPKPDSKKSADRPDAASSFRSQAGYCRRPGGADRINISDMTLNLLADRLPMETSRRQARQNHGFSQHKRDEWDTNTLKLKLSKIPDRSMRDYTL